MNTDPISDFLSRIRNANLVGKTQVEVPYSKIKSNISQIQSLTKTRDTLLPKLMSGQIRVNNIKQTADA